jgi:hypothetical protein
MRRLVLALGLFAGFGQPVNSEPAGWAEASAPCRAYPWAKGTAVKQAKCLTIAEDRVWRPQEPYPDLLGLKQSYRLAFAKRVDTSQIAPPDAALQLHSVVSEINSVWYARRNQDFALEPQRSVNSR